MLAKFQSYILIGLLAFSVVAGGATFYLWNKNSDLRQELSKVEAALEKSKTNLALVSIQLMKERETRAVAERALSKLKDVPDVDYKTPLPKSIGNILNDFSDRMRGQD
ncbi:hypothetical protein SUFG_00007 [Sulfitobacter phage phiCB2047-B]|uniref:Uncharacterized protein n=1 Tax=Sulfitobacter phage phiCB2047-B TaxID=754046 RepID=M4PQK6_9CAUD|nr:hypothetical protein SUFG_00007 [Sulfitobacter phage phiCB2047-B]AGH07380.1 hypothetical protein SUFG_00007 [Sulfitobacter phage phiCB2047-B]